MARYLQALGAFLAALGIVGSVYAAVLASEDEAYFRTAKALEKHPGNVLYTSEFKMAEPRHMLLIGGAAAAAPLGIILGSLCFGLAGVISRLDR